ncbi:MAG TPA: site-2 protease family protein, partial [Candidatus Thermoplasmatota archaeon]|nr:site-2 protease family protein [Candidatus Thermoplasmatota archaeon]
AEPHEGVPVAGAFLGDPAYDAGLRAGDILVAANGQPLLDYDAFVGFMDNRNPGDEVTFELRSGETVEVTLSSRWDHYSDAEKERIQRDDPRLAEAYQQEAFLGISPFTHERASFLAHPFESTAGFLTLISLPLGEVRGAPYLSTYLPAFYDTPFDGDLYWPLATMVFWIFWINLMVGLTNVLPMMPLDGGHIFRDAMGGLFEKARPGMDASRRERLVGRTSTTVSLVILAAFLLQLFGPRLVGAFA